MWKLLSGWMHHISRGWIALGSLVVFLAFTALILPAQSARAGADSGDAGSPDLSFYYTAQDLYEMAERYGEVGRCAYVRARFTFDLVWPLVYTAFLCTGISWVNRRAFGPGSLWQRANLAPVWGALLDYAENVSTSVVMLRYPSKTPMVDVLAGVFTAGKWVLLSASFALLLTGAGAGMWQWMRTRRQ